MNVKDFFLSYGKHYFLYLGKEVFPLRGKQIFPLLNEAARVRRAFGLYGKIACRPRIQSDIFGTCNVASDVTLNDATSAGIRAAVKVEDGTIIPIGSGKNRVYDIKRG